MSTSIKTSASQHTPDPAYYEKGLALFNKYNCKGCHNLSAAPTEEEMGPDLTAIGCKKIYEIEFGPSGIDQTFPAYLDTKLTNPRVFAPGLRMPRFEFTRNRRRQSPLPCSATRAKRYRRSSSFTLPLRARSSHRGTSGSS